MEDGRGLTPGTDGLRSAPELHTHTHTYTQLTRTHHPLAVARAADRRAARAGRRPAFRYFPRDLGRPRARALAYPARPTTPHSAAIRRLPTAVRPQDSRAQPRPPCIYQAKAAPPAANRVAQGARPAARTFKATFSSTAPARGQLSRRGPPARRLLEAGRGHAGEPRSCLRGDCRMQGPGALQEDC